jgi:hypothetical protein
MNELIDQPIASIGDRERRHRDRWTIALALLGVPVASVAAYLSAQLIAHAWEACLVDLDAGGRFALFALMCGMAALAWIGFVVGALATWRLAFIWRFGVGLVLVLAVCGWVLHENVPLGDAAAYAFQLPVPSPTPVDLEGVPFGEWLTSPTLDVIDMSACGPGGIPTWWPSWLPHH